MHTKLISVLVVFCCVTSNVLGGAWGYKSFQNDDALDWIENDFKPLRQRAVENAIRVVAKSNGYPEAHQCSYAIAACEVLAAAQGRPSKDLPNEIAVVAKKIPSKQSDTLRKEARDALGKILTSSELRELWAESKEFENWKRTVEDLKRRV